MLLPDRLYYSKLMRTSRRYAVRMDLKKWCDLHHQHFDWTGKGNAGRVHRIRHLNALLRALKNARLELSAHGQPFQLFAYVDLNESANDALYVHTPNPNGSDFPSPIDRVSSVVAVPPILAGRVDLSRYEIRRYKEVDQAIYYVVPRLDASA